MSHSVLCDRAPSSSNFYAVLSLNSTILRLSVSFIFSIQRVSATLHFSSFVFHFTFPCTAIPSARPSAHHDTIPKAERPPFITSTDSTCKLLAPFHVHSLSAAGCNSLAKHVGILWRKGDDYRSSDCIVKPRKCNAPVPKTLLLGLPEELSVSEPFT